MHLIPLLATLVSAPDSTVYLKTGAVNVGLIALVVEGIIETIVKPWIDHAIAPSDSRHDATIQGLIILLTVGGVCLAQGVGPVGFHGAADVLAVAIQATLALFVEFGIYLKLRGGVPATPTATWLQRIATVHGESLAPLIAGAHWPAVSPETFRQVTPGPTSDPSEMAPKPPRRTRPRTPPAP